MIHQVIQILHLGRSWYFKFIVWTNLSFFFKFILSERLSNSLWGSDVLLSPESILLYNFIEFIMLSYTFLVISFARYKEYMICLILFSKISDVLPAFTYASANGNLWRICLVVNILNCLWWETLATQCTQCKILVNPFPCFSFENIPLPKAVRTFCLLYLEV